MYDILLVDFSRRLCGELQQMLLRSKAQYTIANCVFSSAEALTALSERDFSLVMVHTERFDTAGLWLCNDIRKKVRYLFSLWVEEITSGSYAKP